MTKEEKIAEIKYFFDYFRNQINVIDGLTTNIKGSDKLYVEKQTLLVSLIDSLSNARFNKQNYPQFARRHRERFVRLLTEYSDWIEGELVSVPFLFDHLKTKNLNGLLFNELKSLMEKNEYKGNWLRASKIDLSVSELNSYALNEKEEEAILFYQHFSILYRYRNYLVHEARKPGYGMEFMSYEKDFPIYHSYINEPSLHLLYPMGMLKKIMTNLCNNLEQYFVSKLIDPYDFIEDTLRF
ncbi:MAG: hypothetical protein IPH62_00085 [Ignavibacteriae bacterium]|nr:hypothetical protein [Ignavibacteriota bacterium]